MTFVDCLTQTSNTASRLLRNASEKFLVDHLALKQRHNIGDNGLVIPFAAIAIVFDGCSPVVIDKLGFFSLRFRHALRYEFCLFWSRPRRRKRRGCQRAIAAFFAVNEREPFSGGWQDILDI